jgi:hypothetical protein
MLCVFLAAHCQLGQYARHASLCVLPFCLSCLPACVGVSVQWPVLPVYCACLSFLSLELTVSTIMSFGHASSLSVLCLPVCPACSLRVLFTTVLSCLMSCLAIHVPCFSVHISFLQFCPAFFLFSDSP